MTCHTTYRIRIRISHNNHVEAELSNVQAYTHCTLQQPQTLCENSGKVTSACPFCDGRRLARRLYSECWASSTRMHGSELLSTEKPIPAGAQVLRSRFLLTWTKTFNTFLMLILVENLLARLHLCPFLSDAASQRECPTPEAFHSDPWLRESQYSILARRRITLDFGLSTVAYFEYHRNMHRQHPPASNY